MAGNSLEEKKKRVAALRVKYDSLYRAYEQLLDAPVSSEYRTVREHKEEIQRLKDIKYDNPEGWSREQEARLTALVATPEYMKKFVPIVGPFLHAARMHRHALEDLQRAEQAACVEVAPHSPKEVDGAVLEDERAGPNTADFSENKPLLSKDAYSNDFSSNLSGSSVRQRVISHFSVTNGAVG